MRQNSACRLKVEMDLYEAHKDEWLENHRNEFVVAKGADVLVFFDSFYEAYSAGAAKYGTATDFLVKRVVRQEPIFEVF